MKCNIMKWMKNDIEKNENERNNIILIIKWK